MPDIRTNVKNMNEVRRALDQIVGSMSTGGGAAAPWKMATIQDAIKDNNGFLYYGTMHRYGSGPDRSVKLPTPDGHAGEQIGVTLVPGTHVVTITGDIGNRQEAWRVEIRQRFNYVIFVADPEGFWCIESIDPPDALVR